MNFHVHRHVKADGRELLLFGRDVHHGAPLPEPEAERAEPSHLRWHPLRREWVVFAAARQARTFLPSAQDCPLCPARNGSAGEVPFEDFEIAVFENRFPAFASGGAVPASVSGVDVGAASGRCEVVIYASDHQASLATLSDQRLSLLIAVWGARVKALRDMGFSCVLPFENRGEEIGVTLHHPHGQIYAFSFLPAQLRAAAEAQAEAPVIASLLATLDPALVIINDDLALSFVPPFAMYPYEVWLAPRRRVPSPDLLTDEERSALARALGDAMQRLDALFDAPMPYIMTVQTAPQGFEDSYHMVIEIRPFRRDVGKLKYLAGVEQGAGIFLADILPEDAACRLQQIRR